MYLYMQESLSDILDNLDHVSKLLQIFISLMVNCFLSGNLAVNELSMRVYLEMVMCLNSAEHCTVITKARTHLPLRNYSTSIQLFQLRLPFQKR